MKCQEEWRIEEEEAKPKKRKGRSLEMRIGRGEWEEQATLHSRGYFKHYDQHMRIQDLGVVPCHSGSSERFCFKRTE